ncbi:MAG TPA: hypothetical protein VMH28_02325 [Candidatus Acidoferrales bacterium]|nr:hypothetical protein [Candidatus Acidoferrales bacterium]
MGSSNRRCILGTAAASAIARLGAHKVSTVGTLYDFSVVTA